MKSTRSYHLLSFKGSPLRGQTPLNKTPQRKASGALRSFAESPIVNLSAGLVAIFTAASEIMEAAESAERAGIGAHHCVLAFGVIYALKALPELLSGLDARIKADENETGNDQESVADKFRCLILQSHRPIPPNPKTKQNTENLQQQSDNMSAARQRAAIT